MGKRGTRRSSGFAGIAVTALVLICAVAVAVFITAAHRDKSLEEERAVKWVTANLTVDTLGYVPVVETEVIHDYGEHVFIAARYRYDIPELNLSDGSWLLDMSDLSQQVFHCSEEYPYDYDYSAVAHQFAREWGIR